ncbi:Gfo/Idh/MocA family oxidoreductase [Paenibacillus sp. MMS20-IR301]|uniref:Gfo/Idh/MocA family protein n=1 Tax=Paenibacillus sp. MMS20-IR301 TaxID=2895946 RepID=UPI0028E49EE7|nr:Gfo/Idh/MocA family oxidoreductase [Paenibacillus sp. MMS20-IR301]WNS44286.1 Gfo/Idh/MocA family oxidoreductase [Paenibacillus sp. MMS20-IR301]
MNISVRKRVAIIGIGDIARKVYLPLLSRHDQAEIAGVLSHSPVTVQKAVQAYRLPKGTTDLDELLSWNLDAVFVHSPTPSHYEIVTRCLEHGVSVYVDKPLSYNLEESRQMTELAERKGLLLGVGFNRRYAPMYVAAKSWLHKAGGISHCSAVKHRTKQQAGSSHETVHDDLIHMLDLLLWLCGENYELLHSSLKADAEGRLLQSSGLLDWNGGTSGIYSMVRDAGADLEKLELHGNGRSVEVADMERATLYEQGSLPRTQNFGSWDTVLERRGFAGAVNHFLSNIGTPEKCGIAASAVLASHVLAAKLSR